MTGQSGGMKRFKPIPIVQAGGIQPYHASTPQIPGQALQAMLAGRTASGWNPADITRMTQKAAKRRPASLLDTLAR